MRGRIPFGIMVVSCEELPVVKLLLHSAKYPQSSVNGLLLGSVDGKDGGVTVTDAIPLFHNSLALAAPTEIALSQVR
jgi:hypothetical protein